MGNDGRLDIVIPDAHRKDGSRGPVLLLNDWPRDRFLDAAELDPGILLGAIRTPGRRELRGGRFLRQGAVRHPPGPRAAKRRC